MYVKYYIVTYKGLQVSYYRRIKNDNATKNRWKTKKTIKATSKVINPLNKPYDKGYNGI